MHYFQIYLLLKRIKKEENQRREIRRDREEERDTAKQEEEKLIGDMEQQKIEEEDRIRDDTHNKNGFLSGRTNKFCPPRTIVVHIFFLQFFP